MIKEEDAPSHHLHPPDLRAVLVEQILQACFSQSSFIELTSIIEEMQPAISSNSLRECLFYLIEYYFINYHGNSRFFVLTGAGLGLLYMIKKEKRISKESINKIMINLE
jgi:hypothetical protein